jgi:hypothetical protein
MSNRNPYTYEYVGEIEMAKTIAVSDNVYELL